jgi:excisionase family DNA binding protein
MGREGLSGGRSSRAGQVMTVDQVAEYLQLNRLTVYRYIREGKIPAAKIGKLYRVLKADVDLFLESRKVPAQAAAGPRRSETKPARPQAVVVPTQQPEDVYVGPNWRERLRDREEQALTALKGYPVEWVMRGLH